MALALATGASADSLTRVVDAAGAEVADAALPNEVKTEIDSVRAKDTWAAGQSVVVARAVLSGGARGDGEMCLVQGERAAPGVVINSRTPWCVASFPAPAEAGWKLRATLFGHRAVFKDVPATQGVIVWLGDFNFEKLPPGELVSVKGRVSLPGGGTPDKCTVRVVPKGGTRGPVFGLDGGVYEAQLGPGEYTLQPEAAGFRAAPQACKVAAGGATGPDFEMKPVPGLALKPEWPHADHDVKLDFDATDKMVYVMDQQVSIGVELSGGQHVVSRANGAGVVTVTPGPFAGEAALRALPKQPKWTGVLKQGDLIVVASESAVVGVVEVQEVRGAEAPPRPAPPEVAVEDPGMLARKLHAEARGMSAGPERLAALEKAYQAGLKGMDQSGPEWLRLVVDYADAGVKQGVAETPARLLGEAYERVKARGDEDGQVMSIRFKLARALVRDNKGDQAAPHLRALAPLMAKKKGAESAEVAACLHELGLAIAGSKPADSKKLIDRAAAIRSKLGR